MFSLQILISKVNRLVLRILTSNFKFFVFKPTSLVEFLTFRLININVEPILILSARSHPYNKLYKNYFFILFNLKYTNII